MAVPIRILTAVPICDGHDSAINTINLEFIRHGIEVIYLGYHRSVGEIVRAAIQEDVRAIGISTYNGGHVEFFTEVIDLLKQKGADDIGVFGGGGGTITADDARLMEKNGVDRIFFAGTALAEMMNFVKQTYGRARQPARPQLRRRKSCPDRELARRLTTAENAQLSASRNTQHATRIIGITGPGGAGKTTLIDELALRFLEADPRDR